MAEASSAPRRSHVTASGRPSRKIASHYNHFQTTCTAAADHETSPPTYSAALQHKLAPLSTHPRNVDRRCSPPPTYSCTVAFERQLQLKVESYNPLDRPSHDTFWRDVYLVVRGSLLSIHKTSSAGPGKLLRSYTLQHAEVGLALDCEHAVLHPKKLWGRLVPAPARRRAWQKDPSLFTEVPMYSLRLRAELQQLVLAHESEHIIHELLHALSAAIDISLSLDERSIPRQRTVPRRRQRNHRSHHANVNIEDPTVIAEQERLLRDAYPAFAERRNVEVEADLDSNAVGEASGTSVRTEPDSNEEVEVSVEMEAEEQEEDAEAESERLALEPVQTQASEDDELDLAVIREDFASDTGTPIQQRRDLRPVMSRQTTTTTVTSVSSLPDVPCSSSSASDFGAEGKWQPSCGRTPQQIERYIRRCLPLLPAEAPRASDIVFSFGQRYKINWNMMILENWELQPPTYKAHGFEDAPRRESMASSSLRDSATNISASSVLSANRAGDEIVVIDDNNQTSLERTKSASMTVAESIKPASMKMCTRTISMPVNDLQGVIFSF